MTFGCIVMGIVIGVLGTLFTIHCLLWGKNSHYTQAIGKLTGMGRFFEAELTLADFNGQKTVVVSLANPFRDLAMCVVTISTKNNNGVLDRIAGPYCVYGEPENLLEAAAKKASDLFAMQVLNQRFTREDVADRLTYKGVKPMQASDMTPSLIEFPSAPWYVCREQLSWGTTHAEFICEINDNGSLNVRLAAANNMVLDAAAAQFPATCKRLGLEWRSQTLNPGKPAHETYVRLLEGTREATSHVVINEGVMA